MVEIPESGLRRFRHYAGQPVRDAWIEDNEAEIPARELLDIVLDTGQRLYLCQQSSRHRHRRTHPRVAVSAGGDCCARA